MPGLSATRAVALDAARHIGELLAPPLTGADDAEWIGAVWNDQLTLERAPLGPDLYQGHSGLAVFFAALAGATGEESFERLASQASARIRGQVEAGDIGRLALGLAGLAGLAFAAMTTWLATASDDAREVLAIGATHLAGRSPTPGPPAGSRSPRR